MTTDSNKSEKAHSHCVRPMVVRLPLATIVMTVLIASASTIGSVHAQAPHKAAHRSAHKAASGMTAAQKREYDAAVASGVGDLQALGDNADAQRAATAAAIDAYSHPNDRAAAERYGQARYEAERAQTRVDRSTCSSPDALATRMRNATVQEQNYLTALCRGR